jgi:Effector-associated domain 2/CHAT domain
MDTNTLVEKVIACPIMADAGGRTSIVNQLPANVKLAITPGGTPLEHVTSIVNAAVITPGGLEALVNAIKFFNNGMYPTLELERYVRENPLDTSANTPPISGGQSTPGSTSGSGNQSSPVSPTPDVFKVLFLSADPTDTGRLRLGKEHSDISNRIKSSQYRERFSMQLPQTALTQANVQVELLEKKPQIVHFSGHGMSDGRLAFESATGEAVPISTMALDRVFARLKNIVVCVILNACYSRVQAESIAKHIKYVVGMSRPIGDKAALAFANGFYIGLGAGALDANVNEFENAFNTGTDQIVFDGYEDEVDIPVFYRDGKLVHGEYPEETASSGPTGGLSYDEWLTLEIERLDVGEPTMRSGTGGNSFEQELEQVLAGQSYRLLPTQRFEFLTLLIQTAWENKETLGALFGAATPVISYFLKKIESRQADKNKPTTITVELDGAPVKIEARDAEDAAKIIAQVKVQQPEAAAKAGRKSKIKIKK